MNLSVLRAFLLVCFFLAYIMAAMFFHVFNSRISTWSVGYWVAAGILIGAAPMVLGAVAGVL